MQRLEGMKRHVLVLSPESQVIFILVVICDKLHPIELLALVTGYVFVVAEVPQPIHALVHLGGCKPAPKWPPWWRESPQRVLTTLAPLLPMSSGPVQVVARPSGMMRAMAIASVEAGVARTRGQT